MMEDTKKEMNNYDVLRGYSIEDLAYWIYETIDQHDDMNTANSSDLWEEWLKQSRD